MIDLTLNIETFIYTYLFISGTMIFFNVFCIFQRKGSKKLLEKRAKKLNKLVDTEIKRINKNKKVSEEHQDYLIKKLSRISYLMVFIQVMTKYENSELITKYLEQLQIVFTTVAQKYREKNNTQKAFFAYLVREYKVNTSKNNNFITDFMIENILSNSTYLRENALKALYSFGNSENVLKALDIINRNEINHNAKLITDGLITFTGDHEDLATILYDNFNSFNKNLKISIINYIGFISSRYQKKFLEILKSKSESKEVDLAIIRYFRKHPYKDAEEILISYLKNYRDNQWEYAAIAANALSSYKTKESKDVLIKAISNPNWYVRSNVAESLLKMKISSKEIDLILNLGDLYAKEILEYKLSKGRDYNA